MAQMMRPRLISKEQAKTIASAGGIVGVWTHLSRNSGADIAKVQSMLGIIVHRTSKKFMTRWIASFL
jgi:membrane dipeptidase